MQTATRPNTYSLLWDNSQFFTGTDDPKITAAVEDVKDAIAILTTQCQPFTLLAELAEDVSPDDDTDLIGKIRTIHQQRTELNKNLVNLSTYIYTALSTNTQDPHASTWKPILQQLSAELSQALTPLNVFLTRASEVFISHLLADPALAETAFLIHHQRQLKDQLLSVSEEQLITGLATNGLHTWGNLYSELAGTLK